MPRVWMNDAQQNGKEASKKRNQRIRSKGRRREAKKDKRAENDKPTAGIHQQKQATQKTGSKKKGKKQFDMISYFTHFSISVSAFTTEITDINQKTVRRLRNGLVNKVWFWKSVKCFNLSPNDAEFRKAMKEKRKIGNIRRKR